jgi:drug/metabolite transporter (DMT)-like permease
MSWQLLTLIAVLVFSSSTVLHRILMKDRASDPYTQTIVMYGLAGIGSLMLSLYLGRFHYQVTTNQFLLFIPLACFISGGSVLLFKGLQTLGASESSILKSVQNLWVVIGAFILLGEPFSMMKVAGTIVIMLGICVALWKRNQLTFGRGSLLVIISTLLYSSSDLLSLYFVRDFDPLSLLVYISFLPVIVLLILKPKTVKKIPFYFKPRRALVIVVLSLIDIVGTLSVYMAYQVGRNAAQIGPLMGTITIVSVLIAIIFLKERDNMRNKLIGALIVVVGVWMLL